MRLYLFRHGPAGDKHAWKGADAERPLTAEGTETTRAVSARLAAIGLAPDAIVTSPYVRSSQTADALSEALGGPKPRVDKRLAPGFSAGDLEGVLADHPGDEVVLVGHDPDFSALVAELTGAHVRVRKGGIVRIDLPEPGSREGLLVWLAPPRLMR